MQEPTDSPASGNELDTEHTTRRTVAIIGSRGYPSYYGGFETLVRKLAPYLADRNWDVTVFCRPGSTRNDDPSIDDRIRCIETGGLNGQSTSTLSYGMTSSFRAALARPDVALVLNVANGFWLPFLHRSRVKTLVNVDGIEWEREKWGSNAKRVFRLGAKLTARYADEIVCDSGEIRRIWAQKYNVLGTLIAYGGETNVVTTPVEGLTPRRFILVVARFVPENSINEFLDATERIKEIQIVIVGSSGYGGALEERVRRLASARANFLWLGHVSDDSKLFWLWENCLIYFHGHSVGGTNPALIQAMACRAAVLARDTPYNREVLKSAGEYVVNDGHQIARRIQDLADDPARLADMRNSGYSRMVDEYTWDKICGLYHHSLVNLSQPRVP